MNNKEFIRNFIDNRMKVGNIVYLSWKKLPADLDLDGWHSLHDEDEIAEVIGSYHDGIIIKLADYSWGQVSFFRLFHEENDFHLYEVIWIDDRYYSFNKITEEVSFKTFDINDINIELRN